MNNLMNNLFDEYDKLLIDKSIQCSYIVIN